jgi:hypothetical protein
MKTSAVVAPIFCLLFCLLGLRLSYAQILQDNQPDSIPAAPLYSCQFATAPDVSSWASVDRQRSFGGVYGVNIIANRIDLPGVDKVLYTAVIQQNVVTYTPAGRSQPIAGAETFKGRAIGAVVLEPPSVQGSVITYKGPEFTMTITEKPGGSNPTAVLTNTVIRNQYNRLGPRILNNITGTCDTTSGADTLASVKVDPSLRWPQQIACIRVVPGMRPGFETRLFKIPLTHDAQQSFQGEFTYQHYIYPEHSTTPALISDDYKYSGQLKLSTFADGSLRAGTFSINLSTVKNGQELVVGSANGETAPIPTPGLADRVTGIRGAGIFSIQTETSLPVTPEGGFQNNILRCLVQ